MANWDDPQPEGGGNFVEEYDLTIRSAFFAPNAEYNNGQSLLLNWDGSISNPSNTEAEIPDWLSTLSFSIGSGWVTEDGGKTVTHQETGTDSLFVKSSKLGKLIDQCVNEFGLKEVLTAQGGPFEAKSWEDLVFRIGRKQFDFPVDSKPVRWPIRFVGKANDGPVGTTQAPVTQSVSVSGDDLLAKVTAIILAAPDFLTAQSIAFNDPAVIGNSELVNDLISEDGLYARVKANA